MAIIDDVRVRQIFDPTGENGGYSFEVIEKDLPKLNISFGSVNIHDLKPDTFYTFRKDGLVEVEKDTSVYNKGKWKKVTDAA